MPFYAWASVIVDGRVVATDYAPDAGWLVATPGRNRVTRDPRLMHRACVHLGHTCSTIHSRFVSR